MASSFWSEGDQHAPQVESRQPERRLTLDGLSILVGGGGKLALPLEHLAEVVARLRVQRVQRQRLAVGVRGEIPLLLQAEQHPIIVVRLAEVAAERDDRPVVLLGFHEVAGPPIQGDQVRVRLDERRIARERGFVRGDGTSRRRPPRRASRRAAACAARRPGAQ